MTSLQITSSDIKFTDSNGTTSQTTAYTPLTGHENNEFILPKITVTSNNISAIGSTFPIGGILTSLSKDTSTTVGVPHGFLICDGSAISRSTYNKLFSVIDVYYGSGDGSTTFNLPNFSGRIPIGSTTGITNVAKFQTDYFNGGTGSTYFEYTGNSLLNENQMASHSHDLNWGTVTSNNIDTTNNPYDPTNANTKFRNDYGYSFNANDINYITATTNQDGIKTREDAQAIFSFNFGEWETNPQVDHFPSSQDEYIPKWIAVNYYIKYDY